MSNTTENHFHINSNYVGAIGDNSQGNIHTFNTTNSEEKSITIEEPIWLDVLQHTDSFGKGRAYALLVDSHVNQSKSESLRNVNWSLVIDFDIDSIKSGLFNTISKVYSENQAIHQITYGDKYVSTTKGTNWYHICGLRSRGESLSNSSFKDWKQKYVNDIKDKLQDFAREISYPLTVVVLWQDLEKIKYLEYLLTLLESQFSKTINIVVIAENDEQQIMDLEDDFELKVIRVDLSTFFKGLSSLEYKDNIGEKIVLPSNSGIDITFCDQEKTWLEEDFEIVHKNIGKTLPSNFEYSDVSFYKGKEITWYELSLNIDVTRDKTDEILSVIRRDLNNRKNSRINLYYNPGAGGTTIAKRICWELKNDFPCLIAKSCNPHTTRERIRKVFDETAKSIFLVLDSSIIAESDVEELFDLLTADNMPVTMLLISRRFDKIRNNTRSFLQTDCLTSDEIERFRVTYTKSRPSRTENVKQYISQTLSKCSPFGMGLTVYEKEFESISQYVEDRLNVLTSEIQHDIVKFIAFAHYYGHRSVCAQWLVFHLGLKQNKRVDFKEIFAEEILSLFYEDENYWKPMHFLVSEEILISLLSVGSKDKRVWKNFLADLAILFIDICSEGDGNHTKEIIELIHRIFILRNEKESVETMRNSNSHYSQLINDIPNDEGRLRVLKHLTDNFPNEGHFWAHLGRFQANQRRYDEAIDSIDKAICLNENDHVIFHIKGMILRHQVYEMISNKADIESIIGLAQDAEECFTEARVLSNGSEHGFISEAQMVIRIIDYCHKVFSGESAAISVIKSNNPWLIESFDKVETLLDNVRKKRVGETPSDFEERCRASLDDLYGNTNEALQRWDNMLQRNKNNSTLYAPPIRRQIIWTLFKKNERLLNNFSPSSIKRAFDLIKENLEEEPYNERDLNLWIQISKHVNPAVNLDLLIEKVSYWSSKSDTIESSFYSYVLNYLSVIEGSVINTTPALRALDICISRTRLNKFRTRSFEWLGHGTGISQLIHSTELGEWTGGTHNGFWRDTSKLKRVEGIIKEIQGPQAGTIETDDGIQAFFVPRRSDHSLGRSENKLVTFYLGFSYSGPRAWMVEDLE